MNISELGYIAKIEQQVDTANMWVSKKVKGSNTTANITSIRYGSKVISAQFEVGIRKHLPKAKIIFNKFKKGFDYKKPSYAAKYFLFFFIAIGKLNSTPA